MINIRINYLTFIDLDLDISESNINFVEDNIFNDSDFQD